MTKVRILDGGLGTSLEQQYHVQFSHTTPLWSSHLLVSDQATLLACQRDFVRVPVDVLLTATYQVSFEGAAKTITPQHPDGISESSVSRLVKDAVDIAARAIAEGDGSHQTRIALSVGPYGACMIPSQEYSGAYDDGHNSQDALLEWHTRRLRIFFDGVAASEAPASLVALETIPRLDEITAMRKALASVPELAKIPFWTSCLFPGDNNTLPDGSSVKQAVTAMLDPDISTAVPFAIGINCTKTWKLDSLLREYESAVAALRDDGRILEWPVLVLYPDGTNGEVYNTETQTWDLPCGSQTDVGGPWERQLAEVIEATDSRGHWSEIIVGGCCMAAHHHIKRLRDRLLP